MFLLGYVTANLQIGEELTVEQLLNVLLIGSSNDAANVLAEHVSGSTEDFANLMNQKATEIGCTSSNFLNPSGAHEENHYSTASDMALIAKYAMQNETFRSIVCKTSYKLPSTNKYPNDDRLFTTTNELLIVNNNNRKDNYYYKYAIGVKTGFTTPAQNCLIAAASKNNLELLSVIMGATQNADGLSSRYLDSISLLNYGYDNYTLKKVVNSGDIVQTINVSHASRDTKKLDIVLEKDVSVLIKNENINSPVLPTITLNNNLKAPINKGDVVGKISYTVEDITYEANLLANSNVKKSKAVLHILEIFIILLFIYFLLQLRRKMRKNRRVKKYYQRLNRNK
jgi:D-alanyl-D-alanine carboxypeptidase (penicillin-binding protein 5/6)